MYAYRVGLPAKNVNASHTSKLGTYRVTYAAVKVLRKMFYVLHEGNTLNIGNVQQIDDDADLLDVELYKHLIAIINVKICDDDMDGSISRKNYEMDLDET